MVYHTYFNYWLEVIDKIELNKVVRAINGMTKANLCPNYNNIFNVFNKCPYKKLQVVLVGEEPYCYKDVSNGLLYGVTKGKELPPEVMCLEEMIINFDKPFNHIIFDHTLESIAKQGVLMLHSTLTTLVGRKNIHGHLWKGFTTKLLSNISDKNDGLIFLFFGKARDFSDLINKNKHIVLEEEDMSFYVNKRIIDRPFDTINSKLTSLYGTKIKYYEEL